MWSVALSVSVSLNVYLYKTERINITQVVAKDQWCEAMDEQQQNYWSHVDNARIALFKSPKALLKYERLDYTPLVYSLPHDDKAIIKRSKGV